MFGFIKYSIANKISLLILVSCSVSILVVSSIYYVKTTTEYVGYLHIVQDLQHNLLLLSKQVKLSTTKPLMKSTDRLFESLQFEPYIARAYLVNAKEQVLATYSNPEVVTNLKTLPISKLVELLQFQKTAYVFRHGHLLMSEGLYDENNSFLGMMAIETTLTPTGLTLTGIIKLLIITSMMVYFISTRLQRYISLPIMNLHQSMKRVSFEQDYSVRVDNTSNDEIGELVKGYNDMLATIEDYDKKTTQKSKANKKACLL